MSHRITSYNVCYTKLLRRLGNKAKTKYKDSMTNFIVGMGRKIFNYQLESELSDEIDAVINALVKTGTAIEINTSGKDKCAEFFPSVKLIERCRDNGIKVLISDDAHHVNHIGRHFAEAEELLENLKYTNRWSL